MNYTITGVSNNVKDWSSKYGPMKTYLVSFKEWDKPVKLNQKADTPAPQAGQQLTGTIDPDTFGEGGYKFTKTKPEFKPNTSRPGNDPESMYRTSALKNATEYMANFIGDGTPLESGQILGYAQDFYDWLIGGPVPPVHGAEAQVKDVVPTTEDVDDVNLDDIPF